MIDRWLVELWLCVAFVVGFSSCAAVVFVAAALDVRLKRRILEGEQHG